MPNFVGLIVDQNGQLLRVVVTDSLKNLTPHVGKGETLKVAPNALGNYIAAAMVAAKATQTLALNPAPPSAITDPTFRAKKVG